MELELTREQAVKLVRQHLDTATAALEAAKELSKEHDLSFDWDGPHSGMGGSLDGGYWDPYNSNWDSSSC